jgi:hypothetical protein
VPVFTGKPGPGGSSGAPSITVPADWQVMEGQNLQRLGVTLFGNDADLSMIAIGDKLGNLTVGDLDGSTESGSGAPGSTLVLTGTLVQLNAALANVSYKAGSVAGNDTVSIQYRDQTDGSLVSGSLGITVTAPPVVKTPVPPPANTPLVGTPTPAAQQNFAYEDMNTGTSGTSAGTAYSGPVSYVQHQYIWNGTDGVAMTANTGSVFMHGGPGEDALTAISGSNVLDGGAGSNFLVGASGTDGGFDTFFDDGRGSQITWDTLVNFHHGDAVTIFGFSGGLSTMQWADGQGATGYAGATLHSELGGAGTGINASVTFAGLSVSDALAKLTISTGNVEGNAYLYLKYN